MSLLEELSKPQYADMIAALDYTGLETALSLKNININNRGTFLTELGVLDLLGISDGDVFLTGIENAAVSFPVLNRAIRWLRSDKGIDVGNAYVQEMLDQLVTGGAITSDSAQVIKNYGIIQVSIADQLGITVGRGLLMQTIEEMEA